VRHPDQPRRLRFVAGRDARYVCRTPDPGETPPMNDRPPDRLCTNPKSPYYDEALLERGIGIRFNGAEKTNVEEYCVSEGWIRVAAGKTLDRAGNPMTIKLKGRVEPYFRTDA
jgi:Protein of unknown function (DUF3297)